MFLHSFLIYLLAVVSYTAIVTEIFCTDNKQQVTNNTQVKLNELFSLSIPATPFIWLSIYEDWNYYLLFLCLEVLNAR